MNGVTSVTNCSSSSLLPSVCSPTPTPVPHTSPHAKYWQVLLDAGADVNVQSHSGDTALHVAVVNGFAGIVSTLLEQRSLNLFTKNEYSDSAEKEARYCNELAIADMIAEEVRGCRGSSVPVVGE